MASSLSEEHGSKHIKSARESCHRRLSLLDLSNTEEIAAQEFVCPYTDKELTSSRDVMHRTDWEEEFKSTH